MFACEAALSSRMVAHLPIALSIIALASLVCAGTTRAAEVAAGKGIAQAKCGSCHDATDWDGETTTSLESLIRDVAKGTVSHKQKITVSDDEVKEIAAYWAASSAKKKAR
jgi:cytochrome c553